MLKVIEKPECGAKGIEMKTYVRFCRLVVGNSDNGGGGGVEGGGALLSCRLRVHQQ